MLVLVHHSIVMSQKVCDYVVRIIGPETSRGEGV
jgi:hypothetical protein